MANTTYRPADSAERIAQPIIRNHHSHLADARIVWLFTSSSQSKAQVCPGLLRYAFGKDGEGITPDFVVQIAEVDWSKRNPKAREQFVDELLCRMGQETNQDTGVDKYVINKPDCAIFLGAIERHGILTYEQRQLARVIKDLPEQLTLALDQEAAAPGEESEDDAEDDWTGDPPPDLDDATVRELRETAGAEAR